MALGKTITAYDKIAGEIIMAYNKPKDLTQFQHIIPRKLGDVNVDKKYIKKKKPKPKVSKDKEGRSVIEMPKAATKDL
tara:strand:+ start:672 stop:905 length:234 start_codon:yes stop_codon:yes gene_type:complete